MKKMQDITIQGSFKDYKNIKFLEIKISHDGKTVWINNEEVCLFRAQNIKQINVEDERPKELMN